MSATLPAAAGPAEAGGPAPWAWLDGRPARAAAVVSAVGSLAFAVAVAAYVTQIDITVYLAGGHHYFGPDLYTFRTLRTGLLFTYPPFAGLLFVPLAQLPAVAARVAWAVVDAAALTGLLMVSIRAVRPAWPASRTWRAALLCAGPASLLNPVFVNFQLGQVNLVLALLVVADLLRPEDVGGPAGAAGVVSAAGGGVRGTADAREALGARGATAGVAGRAAGLLARVPPGVLVGVAAAIKLTPLILVPYLFLVGRRRAAAWAAGTFVACEAVAAALSPVASYRYWTSALFQPSRAGNLTYISNQALSSVLERFHHGALSGALTWPVAGVLCAAGLALAVVAYRWSSPFLGLLVCTATGLCVSPITWVHHLVWVVPAVVWLAGANDRPAGGRVVAAGTLVLFWAAPVWWVPYNDMHELHENAWQLAAGNSFFFAMAAFLAGVAVMVLRRGRPARTPSLP